MKIMIKSLFTYCDNISKRPKRKVVLALHCSSFPPAPPPTEWHGARINHMTCSVDGGNSLTAEEQWAEDPSHFMNPGTGRGEKERLEVEKTERRSVCWSRPLPSKKVLAETPEHCHSQGPPEMEASGWRCQGWEDRYEYEHGGPWWPESLTKAPFKDCVGRTTFCRKVYAKAFAIAYDKAWKIIHRILTWSCSPGL